VFSNLSVLWYTNLRLFIIAGDIGVSPASGTAFTGFSFTMDSSNEFATSTQVTGKLFAAQFASPTPSQLTLAVLDMQAAFTDGFGRLFPNSLNLLSGIYLRLSVDLDVIDKLR